MAPHHQPKRRCFRPAPALLESLADELLFLVLDRVAAADPRALKSFALASRACRAAESRHRRVLRPLRADLLRAALARYPSATTLDLSLCPRVTDATLAAALPPSIRAVDLSRSSGFGAAGIAALAEACPGLADLDLSNGFDLGDAAVEEVGLMRQLQRLSLSRCKPVTDMGLGCVAVGCPNLRHLSLKWCIRVSDLSLQLLAHKCKDLRTLDLSYTMVSAGFLIRVISSVLRCVHGQNNVFSLSQIEYLQLVLGEPGDCTVHYS
jgi:F-box and leucine-rich repeat protein 2/20